MAPPSMSGHHLLLAASNPFAAIESHQLHQGTMDNFKASSSGIWTLWRISEGSADCKMQVHSVNTNNEEETRSASEY